jgi:hypothetical protein
MVIPLCNSVSHVMSVVGGAFDEPALKMVETIEARHSERSAGPWSWRLALSWDLPSIGPGLRAPHDAGGDPCAA